MSNLGNMLKVTDSSESKVWFSSDFHLGHNKEFVWKTRGFNSFEEHTYGVINTLNNMVAPQDKLFFLGDFCLNTTPDKFHQYIDQIKCQNIYMLWGNHNNPTERIYKTEIYNTFGKDLKVYPFTYKNLIFMGDYLEIFVNGKIIVLSHYPHSVWNFMKEGAYMLCGHSHYSFKETQSNHKYGKILDVGWDGKGSPYSLNEINLIMDSKAVKEVDHHVNRS